MHIPFTDKGDWYLPVISRNKKILNLNKGECKWNIEELRYSNKEDISASNNKLAKWNRNLQKFCWNYTD